MATCIGYGCGKWVGADGLGHAVVAATFLGGIIREVQFHERDGIQGLCDECYHKLTGGSLPGHLCADHQGVSVLVLGGGDVEQHTVITSEEEPCIVCVLADYTDDVRAKLADANDKLKIEGRSVFPDEVGTVFAGPFAY